MYNQFRDRELTLASQKPLWRQQEAFCLNYASHQFGLCLVLTFVFRTTFFSGASSGIPPGLTIALALPVYELVVARLAFFRFLRAEHPDQWLLV